MGFVEEKAASLCANFAPVMSAGSWLAGAHRSGAMLRVAALPSSDRHRNSCHKQQVRTTPHAIVRYHPKTDTSQTQLR